MSLQCRDAGICFFLQARSVNGEAWSFWRNDGTRFVPLYTCLSFYYSSFGVVVEDTLGLSRPVATNPLCNTATMALSLV